MKLKLGSWTLTPYLIVIALVGLQACGGDGSPATDANPSGYYTGSASVKKPADDTADYSISDLQIMIHNNRIMIMSDANAVLYDGTYSISGNDLTSTVSIYYQGIKQTGAAGSAVLKATVTEGSQITGTFTGTELGNGTFVSTYDSTLNSSTSNIVNVENDNTGGGTRAWTANPNEATAGNNFGIDIYSSTNIRDQNVPNALIFRNCIINDGGASSYVPIIGSSLFNVTVFFEDCDNPSDVASINTGNYTGFSQYKPGTPNKIVFAITNGTYALTDDLDEI